MDITSNYIVAGFEEMYKISSSPGNIEKLDNYEKFIEQREEEIIKSTNICDQKLLQGIRDHFGGLNINKFKIANTKQFHNVNVMNGTLCTVDSIFYTNPVNLGTVYMNNRIRSILKNMKQIGADSANGYALVSDFKSADKMFVVKVSKNPQNDELLHELFVGLYGTNLLRKYIPNFSYIFGGFKCSPPLIDQESKRVVSWCLNDRNAVNYVIYEYINPSISFGDYIKTCTGPEFINIYLQILYALRLGLKLIDFTHYDLHPENILLREMEQKDFQIQYETEKGMEYIRTKYVPTIVDFGMSHIKYGTEHFGKSGLIAYSIYPYRSWIMHDAYKLLMFGIFHGYRANNSNVINELTKIFRFFNKTEDPITAANSQIKYYFSLPLDNNTNNITLDGLIRHIRLVSDTSFINPVKFGVPTLDCQKMCLSIDNYLSEINVNPTDKISVPTDITDFYDLAIRLQSYNEEAQKESLMRIFPYQSSMNNHIILIKSILNDLISEKNGLKIIDLKYYTVGQLFNYNTMTLIRSMYNKIGALVDKSVTLKYNYDIGLTVAETYDDKNGIATLNSLIGDFNKNIKPVLERSREILESNHKILDNLNNEVYIQQALAIDKRLKWYWEGRRLFDYVFNPITFK